MAFAVRCAARRVVASAPVRRALGAALATARPSVIGPHYHALTARPLATVSSHAAPVDGRPPFTKILVANRGEIACRVMRTAQRLGVKCVAVFSDADRDALHVRMADEAHHIGPAASADSYLRMDRILDVARRTGAQAIHPGYGFLSENAEAAEYWAAHGVVFIGPPASAITAMGSKSASKEIMERAGVPVVPGYHGTNQDPAHLKRMCAEIGYPVLIKAVKGGGGKGMRIVHSEEEFDEMLASAKREAKKSFGDDRVLVEKYLTRPRHVEVQVFCDTHGNAVYLFERDCSVQRRHQKIIEEAPAPGLSEDLRRELGEKAVAAAKAVNYVGAGTVEFIMDAETSQYYFMEMNTRLQVEHPITEMITGTDLVEWQLAVAAGNPLPVMQQDLRIKGWAFEARIYAENPRNNFLPDTGTLQHLSAPSWARVETGVRQGDTVSVHYDPMIAKVVVHGKDRGTALRKLSAALDAYRVVGLETNVEFLQHLAAHPAFVAAEVETGFIGKYGKDLMPPKSQKDPEAAACAALALALQTRPTHDAGVWSALGRARLNTNAERTVCFGEQDVAVSVTDVGCGYQVVVHSGGQENKTCFEVTSAHLTDTELFVDFGTHQLCATVVLEPTHVHVFPHATAPANPAKHFTYTLPQPAYRAKLLQQAAPAGGNAVVTPMPCKIAAVQCAPGDRVRRGQALVVLEAMKMEHVMRAPRDAVVKRVVYKPGELVEENKVLVTFEEDAEASKSAA